MSPEQLQLLTDWMEIQEKINIQLQTTFSSLESLQKQVFVLTSELYSLKQALNTQTTDLWSSFDASLVSTPPQTPTRTPTQQLQPTTVYSELIRPMQPQLVQTPTHTPNTPQSDSSTQ